MRAPGRYIVGLLQIAIGAALLLATARGNIPTGSLADAAAGAVLVLALGLALFPEGPRGHRLVALILLAATGVILQVLAYRFETLLPIPGVGVVPGALLITAGIALFLFAERRRRRVRMRIETDRVVVTAQRWGI
jgi:protein-S-isoprenylcysteine O-methyltransferase Ste14